MLQKPHGAAKPRLNRLDLAQYLAITEMVIVNFKIAMGVTPDGSLLDTLTSALEGGAGLLCRSKALRFAVVRMAQPRPGNNAHAQARRLTPELTCDACGALN